MALAGALIGASICIFIIGYIIGLEVNDINKFKRSK